VAVEGADADAAGHSVAAAGAAADAFAGTGTVAAVGWAGIAAAGIGAGDGAAGAGDSGTDPVIGWMRRTSDRGHDLRAEQHQRADQHDRADQDQRKECRGEIRTWNARHGRLPVQWAAPSNQPVADASVPKTDIHSSACGRKRTPTLKRLRVSMTAFMTASHSTHQPRRPSQQPAELFGLHVGRFLRLVHSNARTRRSPQRLQTQWIVPPSISSFRSTSLSSIGTSLQLGHFGGSANARSSESGIAAPGSR
jgi:hypothetical protein